jgi:hypothetical protein
MRRSKRSPRRAASLPAQVALAWVCQRPGVVAPIVGASKLNHIEDAVAALSLNLGAEEMKALEAPYVPHPSPATSEPRSGFLARGAAGGPRAGRGESRGATGVVFDDRNGDGIRGPASRASRPSRSPTASTSP